MFDMFGSELPLAARFFIAFVVVLVLIGVITWLVRRFGANRLGGGGARGRQPRLAVIDAASVDGRRRLVLIRRDNIEHLLMIGGPTDVVIEPNIVRAAAARDVSVGREVPRAPEPAARSETAWPLQPSNEPPPVAPARPPHRAPTTDEPWLPPEPGARPRPADASDGFAADLTARRATDATHASFERQEPRVSAPPAEIAASHDRNLAEMAQQLEAALRRAPAPDGRPPVTDPLVAQPPHIAVKTPQAPRPPVAEFKPRVEPKLEPKIEPKAEPKTEPRIEPKFERKAELKIEPKVETKSEPKNEIKIDGKTQPKSEPQPTLDKDLYDNLEEEMASLLGRSQRKS